MSHRFYLIGGLNNPNLKQAFLSFIPEPLGEETFILFSATNKTITDITFGELCQLVFKAIEKMYSQNKFLQEHIKQTKNLDKVCTNKELYTKCPTNPTHRTKKFRKKKGFNLTSYFLRRKVHGNFFVRKETLKRRNQLNVSSAAAKMTS